MARVQPVGMAKNYLQQHHFPLVVNPDESKTKNDFFLLNFSFSIIVNKTTFTLGSLIKFLPTHIILGIFTF